MRIVLSLEFVLLVLFVFPVLLRCQIVVVVVLGMCWACSL